MILAERKLCEGTTVTSGAYCHECAFYRDGNYLWFVNGTSDGRGNRLRDNGGYCNPPSGSYQMRAHAAACSEYTGKDKTEKVLLV